jgi:hypothetical protein
MGKWRISICHSVAHWGLSTTIIEDIARIPYIVQGHKDANTSRMKDSLCIAYEKAIVVVEG